MSGCYNLILIWFGSFLYLSYWFPLNDMELATFEYQRQLRDLLSSHIHSLVNFVLALESISAATLMLFMEVTYPQYFWFTGKVWKLCWYIAMLSFLHYTPNAFVWNRRKNELGTFGHILWNLAQTSHIIYC